MTKIPLNINCDVGEGFNNESKILPLISYCNIACGGHAGDAQSMENVTRLALENNVKIGAHPSYPDRKNFGRQRIEINLDDLQQSIVEQIESLNEIVSKQYGKLYHVKPHGALYNDACKTNTIANVVVNAIIQVDADLVLMVPENSIIAAVAKEKNLEVLPEAFGDRNYNEDLSLVSRNEKNALITAPEEIYNHIQNMITNRTVRSITGKQMPIHAKTFCIHGDTTGAIEILNSLYNLSTQS